MASFPFCLDLSRKFKLSRGCLHTLRSQPMYDIEATVTKSTPTELKFTGEWPLDWLQAPEKSTEVIAELLPGKPNRLLRYLFNVWRFPAIEHYDQICNSEIAS